MSGRKRRLPGMIEPSKEERHCGADCCNDQLVGTSFAYHYRSRTDFDKLKVLRNLPRQPAEEELKTVECAPTQLIIHLSLQNILSSTHWSLWWIGCVQLKGGKSSSTRKTQMASWSQDRAGWLTQVMAQPSRLLEKRKIKSRNCHISFGKKKS